MRRLIVTAAFALLLAVPAWSQHGGGGHGGGHASGGFGHSGGGFHSGGGSIGGGRASSGVHVASGSAFSHSTLHSGFSRGPFLHDGFRGSRFRAFGGRNCYGYPCRAYGYGYPYLGYDPYWWWNNDSSYDDDYYNNLSIADQMNEQSLEQQQMWRQEEADGDQDAYAPREYSRPRANSDPAAKPDSGSAIIPPTLLVFHDQHKEEVRNYAIVGSTLWNFAPQHTEKISLADLDLPATIKANDDRGVTFRIPGGVAQ